MRLGRTIDVLNLLFNVGFLFRSTLVFVFNQINQIAMGEFPFRVGRDTKVCLLSYSPDQVATALLLRFIEVRLGHLPSPVYIRSAKRWNCCFLFCFLYTFYNFFVEQCTFPDYEDTPYPRCTVFHKRASALLFSSGCY